MNDIEARVLGALDESRARDIAQVASAARVAPSQVGKTLAALRSRGVVRTQGDEHNERFSLNREAVLAEFKT